MTDTPANTACSDSEQRAPRRQWARRTPIVALLLLSLTQLSGCFSTSSPRPDKALAAIEATGEPGSPCSKSPAPQASVAEAEPATTAPPETETLVAADLWERLRGNYALQGFEHPRIQHEIERLQHSPAAFSVLISRAEPFLHHIVAEVERRGLPGELALLPAVESGFRPYAYSRSGAAGLWQFMPATGAMLGLQQDWWYDGRRDVLAATQAALDYLEHLNQRLDGDWLHAIAAYNAGGGTVRRAVRKARTAGMSTTFWNLDLPRETDHYVPRLLALAEVIADPGRYGLALPSLEDRPYFASVPSGGQIDLKVAADLAQLPLEDLLALNPGFNRWSTRPDGPHRLLIPVEHAEAFSEALAQLPEKQRLRWQPHEIRSGENLGLIARRYGVSVEAVQQANGLQSHLIRAGRVLMIPLSDSVVAATSSPRLGIPRSRVRYQVRKGDSLYKIARKFQVKVADLRRWNTVDRYLQPGQRLTVFVDPTRQTL